MFGFATPSRVPPFKTDNGSMGTIVEISIPKNPVVFRLHLVLSGTFRLTNLLSMISQILSIIS